MTGASYGDGQANSNPTWSYDAAGNRNDAVTDNLNRATSLGGVSATNDILGNRLTLGSNSYGWDQLNRMTSFSNGTVSTAYTYRADGMRIYKSNANGATSYRYDGQMGIEDVDYVAGSVQKVTDYGLGARGIDALYVTQSGNTTSAYPLYNTHGNMISTLTRQGSGGYQYAALRTFDAWGQIRLGAATGDPKGRYCANLGHKQDDESSLVYMRARYYEPGTGRFISEDPEMNGRNLFSYASDNPIMFADRTGEDPISVVFDILGLAWGAGTYFWTALGDVVGLKRVMATTCGKLVLLLGALMIYEDLGATFEKGSAGQKDLAFLFGTGTILGVLISTILCNAAIVPPNQIGQEAVGAIAAYAAILTIECGLTTLAGDTSE